MSRSSNDNSNLNENSPLIPRRNNTRGAVINYNKKAEPLPIPEDELNAIELDQFALVDSNGPGEMNSPILTRANQASTRADEAIQDIQEASSSSITSCYNFAKTPLTFAGNGLYHVVDLIRIWLVTDGLASRFTYQLIKAVESSAMPSIEKVNYNWISWSVIGGSLALAILAKSINHIKEYQGKEYPALQDYLYNAFSSSIFYMLLDAASDSGKFGTLSLGWFITVSLIVPAASILLSKLTVTDSSNRFTFTNSEANKNNFPKIPEASYLEKIFNISTGLAYGGAASLLIWAVSRELHRKTVSKEIYQLVIIGLSYLASGASGFFITSHPRWTNNIIALTKVIKDSSLSYAALSGIAYQTLMFVNQCPGQDSCWEEGIEKNILAPTFLVLSAAIGLFSGATTLLKFKKMHEQNLEFFQLPKDLSTKFTENVNWAYNGISSCVSTMFCCSEKKPVEDNESEPEYNSDTVLEV